MTDISTKELSISEIQHTGIYILCRYLCVVSWRGLSDSCLSLSALPYSAGVEADQSTLLAGDLSIASSCSLSPLDFSTHMYIWPLTVYLATCTRRLLAWRCLPTRTTNTAWSTSSTLSSPRAPSERWLGYLGGWLHLPRYDIN